MITVSSVSFLVYLATTFFFVSISFAQIPRCDTVLLQKTLHVLSENSRAKLSWMRLVDQENYGVAKREAAGDVPGYFSGNYDSFDEKRNKLFEQENYGSDKSDSAHELRVFLPAGAVPAWTDCVRSQSDKLFAWIEDIDEKGATLGVKWVPPPGVQKILKKFTVESRGIRKDASIRKVKDFAHGARYFLLERPRVGVEIRGTISGQVKDGQYSQKFYIPAMFPVVINGNGEYAGRYETDYLDYPNDGKLYERSACRVPPDGKVFAVETGRLVKRDFSGKGPQAYFYRLKPDEICWTIAGYGGDKVAAKLIVLLRNKAR